MFLTAAQSLSVYSPYIKSAHSEEKKTCIYIAYINVQKVLFNLHYTHYEKNEDTLLLSTIGGILIRNEILKSNSELQHLLYND